MKLKPNHICKNANCRKEYYACDYCGKTLSWRSMTCSPACYDEYMEQITAARANSVPVNLYPERTDMTHDEVVILIDNTPIDKIKSDTMDELSEYQESIDAVGLGVTIDQINKEISSKPKAARKNQ